MSNNKPITLYGDGEQIRDFIYLEDIACVKEIENLSKETVYAW